MLIFILTKKINKSILLGKRIFITYLLWCFFILFESLSNLVGKQNIAFFTHNTLSTLSISLIFIFSEISNIKSFYQKYIKIGIPIFLILSPLMIPGCWGWYLTPIHIIIIFLPKINIKWKIIYCILFVMSIYFTDKKNINHKLLIQGLKHYVIDRTYNIIIFRNNRYL